MKCPRCQAVNPDAARFCNSCGNPLSSAEVGAQGGGERKLVTVLFADVVGSTSIGESLDPEQVTDIMNGAFAIFNAAVARYGGTVARLMGDAVLAFFGAPIAHEDDPERAVLAGLDIQSAAREYARQVEREYSLDFNIRVGINTGLAVLDIVGDQIKAEYTAMGDTTNVASRLQSAADPGTVLVSGDIYRLVKSQFDFGPRMEIEVKGKSTPIEAFEVRGSKEMPGSTRGLEGLASPLVGRDAELRLLRDRISDLSTGRGALVAVVGEAGLGKSRLVAEAHKMIGGDTGPDILWLEGRAISYGQAISYYPWRQIIRRSIGAREGDSPESVRDKLKVQCTTNCCALPGGDVPFLEVMLDVESEESLKQITGMNGDALVRYITDAVKGHLCETLAQVKPTVLVFDDLHWADQASLDLLLNVSDLVGEMSLVIICLLRPDKAAASGHFIEQVHARLGERYSEITLEPLSAASAGELLENLLHIEDLPESLRSLILEKAEGNPFFVEEVIRSLIDSKHIVRENDHWRATHDITQVSVPDTLAGVLSARIDRLPGDTKRVTQTASVVGRIFSFPVLEAICESAPPTERIEHLEPHLDLLSYEELVRERAREPDLEYIFKHTLTQEAAYNSLLIRKRKEYHRRAAGALEQLYPQRLDELAPTLALHCWNGEDWLRAADYSIRAGAGAAKVYAMRAAIENYSRAIEALDKLPDTPQNKLVDALLGWVQAAFRFKPYEEILARADRAVAIARSLGDKRRLAEALYWTANTHIQTGRPTLAYPAVMECFALAAELGDEQLALLPSHFRAVAAMDSDPRSAVAQFDHVIEMARKYKDRNIEAAALGFKGLVTARLGEFERSQKSIRTAFEAIDGLNLPMTEADLYLFSGWSYLDMGDATRGLEYAELGVNKAVSADNIECICHGYACLGFNFLQLQKLDEASEAFQEAIRRSVLSGAARVENMGRTGLALAQFLSGRVEAIKDMETTLESARALGDLYTVALLSQSLGRSYTQLGEYERAEVYLQDALANYRENNMRPYIARTLQALAYLYDRQGRNADAERVRSEAQTLSGTLAEKQHPAI